jgi:Flp pilus assembly protein TadD
MSKARLFAVAFVFTLLLATTATAQLGTTGNSISGQVYDTTNRPLTNLQVELLDDVNSLLKRTRTDGVGRYLFTGLPQGNFQVRVITVGTNLVGQTARVEIVTVSRAGGRGRTSEIYDFTLRTTDEEKSGRLSKAPAILFSQEVPDTARQFYEAAVEKLDKNQGSDEGMEALKKALEIFPKYYAALERLGSEYVKQQQYLQALEILNKAIAVNGKGHLSFYALGIAQYNLKQTDNAIQSLRKSVALAPSSVNAQFWLGIVLFRTKKFDDAETPLKRASEMGGNQIPDVHMFLAQIYSNSNRYLEAVGELELFLKEVPNATDSEKIKNIIKQLREKAVNPKNSKSQFTASQD